MRAPVTYPGGKNTMLKYLLPLEPKHKVYAELFAGGASYFSPSNHLK